MSATFMNADLEVWKTAPEHPRITQPEVHVWRAEFSVATANTESSWAVLSVEEQDRAKSLIFDNDRSKFILAKGVLRKILRRYLSVPPDQLRFSHNLFGKPYLCSASGKGTLSFNLSHAG